MPAGAADQKGAATATASAERPTDYLPQTLVTGLSLLECFSNVDHATNDGLSVRTISDLTGIHTSTLYRYVRVLAELGFLARTAKAGRYVLGPRLVQLGASALLNERIFRLGQPVIADLSRRVGLSSNLGVLHSANIIHIAYANHSSIQGPGRPTDEPASASDDVHLAFGQAVPAHCTSLGKAILAYLDFDEVLGLIGRAGWQPLTRNTIVDPHALREDLDRTRRRGYALDRGEKSLGTYCIAAPVFDHSSRPLCAISITGSRADLTKAQETSDAIEQVQKYAAQLQSALTAR